MLKKIIVLFIVCFLQILTVAEGGKESNQKQSYNDNNYIEKCKNTLASFKKDHEKNFAEKQHKEKLLSFREDTTNNSILHLALICKDNNFAETILEYYPDLVNVENKANESPIYVADRVDNIDGVKLCLEYCPKRGSSTNKSYEIFKKVKGHEPYSLKKDIYSFFQPKNGNNNDKLVIVLDLVDPDYNFDQFINPDPEHNTFYKHFSASNVPVLVIGNKRHSLTYNLIKGIIDNKKIVLPENILIIIDCHGVIKNKEHVIPFDNTQCRQSTKKLFNKLKEMFPNKKLQVLLTACFGGKAIDYVNELPKGSSLLTFSQCNKPTKTGEVNSIFENSEIKENRTYVSPRIENYQQNPKRFSLEHYLMLYLFSLNESNNIPELAISVGGKIFNYDDLTEKFSLLKKSILEKERHNSLLVELKDYSGDKDDRIKLAIKNIKNATSIDNLKASTNNSKLYNESTWKNFETLLDNDEFVKTLPCTIDIDDNNEKENIKEEYFTTESTDYYSFSYLADNNKDTIKQQPEQPNFGVALAILHFISKKTY